MVHHMSSRSTAKTGAKRTSKSANLNLTPSTDEHSEHESDKRKKKRIRSTATATNKNKHVSKSSAQNITQKHFFTPTSSRRGTQITKSVSRSCKRNLIASLSQSRHGTPHTSTPVMPLEKKKKKTEEISSNLDTSFKEYRINARNVGRWTMLDKRTTDFVIDAMNTCISSVIHKASQEKSSEVFSVMNGLRNRLMKQLSTLKAPANRVGSYKNVTSELYDEVGNSKMVAQKIRQSNVCIEFLKTTMLCSYISHISAILRKACTECESQQEKLEQSVKKESEIVMTLCAEVEACGLLIEDNDSE